MVSFVHHSFSVRTTFGQRFVCIRTSFGKRTYIVRASSVHGSGIVRIVNFYVTRTVRPHVKELPSFIQDTTDYLKKMESLNPLPSNTILASMDVSSLYTNIPQDEGIAACEEAWNTRSENKNVSSVHECPTRTIIFYVQWTVKLG